MRRIPFYRQETHYTCGPSVLRMALAAYGRKVSEAYLKRLCGTSARHGTSNNGLMRCLRTMEVPYITEYRARYDELQIYVERGVVIVDWMPQVVFPEHPGFQASPQFDPDEDAHYAIVAAAGKRRVFLQDPVLGRRVRLKREEFVRAWRDPTSKSYHWVLVVMPPEEED